MALLDSVLVLDRIAIITSRSSRNQAILLELWIEIDLVRLRKELGRSLARIHLQPDVDSRTCGPCSVFSWCWPQELLHYVAFLLSAQVEHALDVLLHKIGIVYVCVRRIEIYVALHLRGEGAQL